MEVSRGTGAKMVRGDSLAPLGFVELMALWGVQVLRASRGWLEKWACMVT